MPRKIFLATTAERELQEERALNLKSTQQWQFSELNRFIAAWNLLKEDKTFLGKSTIAQWALISEQLLDTSRAPAAEPHANILTQAINLVGEDKNLAMTGFQVIQEMLDVIPHSSEQRDRLISGLFLGTDEQRKIGRSSLLAQLVERDSDDICFQYVDKLLDTMSDQQKNELIYELCHSPLIPLEDDQHRSRWLDWVHDTFAKVIKYIVDRYASRICELDQWQDFLIPYLSQQQHFLMNYYSSQQDKAGQSIILSHAVYNRSLLIHDAIVNLFLTLPQLDRLAFLQSRGSVFLSTLTSENRLSCLIAFLLQAVPDDQIRDELVSSWLLESSQLFFQTVVACCNEKITGEKQRLLNCLKSMITMLIQYAAKPRVIIKAWLNHTGPSTASYPYGETIWTTLFHSNTENLLEIDLIGEIWRLVQSLENSMGDDQFDFLIFQQLIQDSIRARAEVIGNYAKGKIKEVPNVLFSSTEELLGHIMGIPALLINLISASLRFGSAYERQVSANYHRWTNVNPTSSYNINNGYRGPLGTLFLWIYIHAHRDHRLPPGHLITQLMSLLKDVKETIAWQRFWKDPDHMARHFNTKCRGLCQGALNTLEASLLVPGEEPWLWSKPMADLIPLDLQQKLHDHPEKNFLRQINKKGADQAESYTLLNDLIDLLEKENDEYVKEMLPFVIKLLIAGLEAYRAHLNPASKGFSVRAANISQMVYALCDTNAQKLLPGKLPKGKMTDRYHGWLALAERVGALRKTHFKLPPSYTEVMENRDRYVKITHQIFLPASPTPSAPDDGLTVKEIMEEIDQIDQACAAGTKGYYENSIPAQFGTTRDNQVLGTATFKVAAVDDDYAAWQKAFCEQFPPTNLKKEEEEKGQVQVQGNTTALPLSADRTRTSSAFIYCDLTEEEIAQLTEAFDGPPAAPSEQELQAKEDALEKRLLQLDVEETMPLYHPPTPAAGNPTKPAAGVLVGN